MTSYLRIAAVRLSFMLLPAVLVLGCLRPQTVVKFNVTVKTNQGDPIDQAAVIIDGEKIGETDSQGLLNQEVELPAGGRVRLEVRKDSQKYYFAPFFDSFHIDETGPQTMPVTATLYFVPKPAPDEKVADNADKALLIASENQQLQDKKQDKNAEAAQRDQTTAASSLKPEDKAAKEQDISAASKPSVVTGKPAQQPKSQGFSWEEEPLAEAEEPLAQKEKAPDTDDPPAAAAPSEHQIALTHVETPASEVTQSKEDFPKLEQPKQADLVYTVHVIANETPVSQAVIYTGEGDDSGLKEACTTNARGRCVIRFAEKPGGPTSFVVKKTGFKTKTLTSRIVNKGTLRLALERGQTVDIYALTKSYNHSRGLEGVEVYIKGKRVGSTDKFGHYSHVYTGKADDLMALTLKPRGFLPEVYETDFVTSGPMTLVRYFTPVDPPSVRVTLLPVRPAGTVAKQNAEVFNGTLDREIRRGAVKHLFSSTAFREYPLSLYEKAAVKAGRSLSELMRQGWQETSLKSTVDALILPTLIMDSRPTLELSVIDSKGRVLTAAKGELDNLSDKASVERALAVIAAKVTRAFPFEGSVLSKSSDKVAINIGFSSGRGLKPGDLLEVYGIQAERDGRTQTHKKIGLLKVREVKDSAANCDVTKLVERSTINRGDLAVLRLRQAGEITGPQLRVLSGKEKSAVPIAQANVYLNDLWLGSTDESGRLYGDITGSGTLRVIKHGFKPYEKGVTLGARTRIDVRLAQETAFLRLESKPSAATVKVDGVVVGKTPLASALSMPAGFVKIELEAPSGYKNYAVVLELDQGTLDLTGARAVELEKDYRSAASQLLASGRVEEAVAKLTEVPREHSDFLISRHEIGEIYLTMLNQPAKAAEAFHEVTRDQAVNQFSDKRFIGSHINEGIALFLVGERLAADEPKVAAAHYEKAIEVLDQVAPQLRFVPRDQYAQAVHNVDYHRALSRHKLWLTSKNPQVLAEAIRSWRNYVDGSARSVAAEGAAQSYVANAEIFYKQAQSSMVARSDL